jgi:hypothetical protein
MNLVDLMDQLCSTNPTKYKETHVHMSIWTMILDLAYHQGFASYNWLVEVHPEVVLDCDKSTTICEFKRQVREKLCAQNRYSIRATESVQGYVNHQLLLISGQSANG